MDYLERIVKQSLINRIEKAREELKLNKDKNRYKDLNDKKLYLERLYFSHYNEKI